MPDTAPNIPNRFYQPLQIITDRLKDSGIDWVITGSLGWALQGVQVDIHDIDLQTDEFGARRMEEFLSDFSRQKLYWRASDRMRSHFAVLEINGIQVEIMGDFQKLLPDGSWEKPVDIGLHRKWVDFQLMKLPVFALDYEYTAYNLMGRNEKARLLEPYIQKGKNP